MHDPSGSASFTGLVDLACELVGGTTVAATDDFFAAKENLIKPGPAAFDADRYTDLGKWMDGWESRRKRVPGHDHCVIRLGLAGIIHGVDIDTSHFLGNHPPYASLQGATFSGDRSALPEEDEWEELLPRSPLAPGSHNLFPVLNTGRWQSSYGKGAPGLQLSLPVSAELSELLSAHLNLGATWTPNAVGAPEVWRSTLDSSFGASVVFQVSGTFNPLVELFGARLEGVQPDGSIESTRVMFVNPGVRFAINRPSGLQIVPGVAYTIGVGPSSGTRAILLYLSFEHPLPWLKKRL